MAGFLQALTSDAWEGILQRLHLRDLASLAACSKGLKDLVDSQPESVWQAAATHDPGNLQGLLGASVCLQTLRAASSISSCVPGASNAGFARSAPGGGPPAPRILHPRHPAPATSRAQQRQAGPRPAT